MLEVIILDTKKIIYEAYNPKLIWKKIFSVSFMRIKKLLAVFINEKFGYIFLGWNGIENKLLDNVGNDTIVLYENIYQSKLNQTSVLFFLKRRAIYCLLTMITTIFQIIVSYLGFWYITIIISTLMIPITILDRQWCALVTKMPPRYERSLILQLQMCSQLHLKSDVCIDIKKRNTIRNNVKIGFLKIPDIILVGFEILMGFIQFCTGAIIFGMTIINIMDVRCIFDINLKTCMYIGIFVRLLKEITNIEILMGFIQFCTGTIIFGMTIMNIMDLRCIFNIELKTCLYIGIIVRLLKEITNIASTSIEWILTPIKYKNNIDLIIEFAQTIQEQNPTIDLLRIIREKNLNVCECLLSCEWIYNIEKDIECKPCTSADILNQNKSSLIKRNEMIKTLATIHCANLTV